MSSALLLLLLTETSSAVEDFEEAQKPLTALILPAISGETTPREPTLDEAMLAAFSDHFADAAIGVFLWRRHEVVSGDEAKSAIASVSEEACRSEACARAAGASLGATEVVFSRLTRLADGSCAAFAARHDLLGNTTPLRMERAIAPCRTDNVLGAALDLGRAIAEGPRAPKRVSLRLTPLEIPDIDVPDIPEIAAYETTTSTRARRMPLENALELYRKNHMFVFEDDEAPGFFVARGNRLINECDVRRAASVPISPSVLEFCEGNDWEWAWTIFPIGLLFAGLGASEFEHGGGEVTFAGGSLVALGSALVAVLLNVNAADVNVDGFASSREQIEAIVAKANQDWRLRVDLTEAEVGVAGMRK